MKRLLLTTALGVLLANPLRAQNAPSGSDTTQQLPRLDIPEITIVGKKAIMLPFARKGEVYDVDVYSAPPPDTSLLGDRKMMSLPIGSPPRYEEQLMPWRASLEGGLGNYTTGKLFGYVDYTMLTWGLSAKGGYMTTAGHTNNSDGKSTQIELTGRSLVSTDNDVLREMRADGEISYHHDTYGMYGISSSSIRRTRNTVGLLGGLGSTNREGPTLDVTLGADIVDITDNSVKGDSSVSIVSPILHGVFATDVNATRFVGDIVYQNSSLDYQQPAQSPSLAAISFGARWEIGDQFLVTLKGLYEHATASDGGDHTLVAPTIDVSWQRDKDRVWSFWYHPEIRLAPYADLSELNPYLIREIAIKPERRPLNFGSTLQYNSGLVSFKIEGSYSHTYDKAVELADSGRIALSYVDVDRVTVQGEGTVTLSDELSVRVEGAIQPARGKNTSVQLPMLPIAHLKGHLQYLPGIPFILWSELEYTSKRNVDLAGSRTLNDAVLVHAGLSTHAVPRTSLSFQIKNIFNTAFQWWDGYSAPGRQFTVEAKVDL